MANLNDQIIKELHDYLGVQDNDYAQELDLGSNHIKNHINNIFSFKVVEMAHSDAIATAFHKVHNNCYINDPYFVKRFKEECAARGISEQEINKSIDLIEKVKQEVEKDELALNEKPVHPLADGIKKVSKPGEENKFEDVKGDKAQGNNIESDLPQERS